MLALFADVLLSLSLSFSVSLLNIFIVCCAWCVRQANTWGPKMRAAGVSANLADPLQQNLVDQADRLKDVYTQLSEMLATPNISVDEMEQLLHRGEAVKTEYDKAIYVVSADS